jgi:hypothetical protein
MKALRLCAFLSILPAALSSAAQESLSGDQVARIDAALRDAFAFAYGLPSDTAGAAMGSWVVDTADTTPATELTSIRRIVLTKLSDTGQDLNLNEVVGEPGTSLAQIAAGIAAVQRMEGKISKAEADTSLEIVVAVNERQATVTGVSDDARRNNPTIAGAAVGLHVDGSWVHVEDRELEIGYERWSPATLLVGFGAARSVDTKRASPKESLSTFTIQATPTAAAQGIHTLLITAQGNEEMVKRVIKETKWGLL